VLSVVSVWIRLPHLPLHCWNPNSLRNIGNSLGKYIDSIEPKANMFACARICVEVDLEKGLPEAILLKLDNWKQVQKLDYEQLPFKCKVYHEYVILLKIARRRLPKPLLLRPLSNNGGS
jgi:hypothetical protein